MDSLEIGKAGTGGMQTSLPKRHKSPNEVASTQAATEDGHTWSPNASKSQQPEEQQKQYSEVIQAVWGEKGMQQGNAQEEARQQRISIIINKKEDEMDRRFAI